MRRDSMNLEAPLSSSHSSNTLLYLLKLARDLKLEEPQQPDTTEEKKEAKNKSCPALWRTDQYSHPTKVHVGTSKVIVLPNMPKRSHSPDFSGGLSR